MAHGCVPRSTHWDLEKTNVFFPYQFITLQRPWARILVQVTKYRILLIGRDGHLDQSEDYDISQLVQEYGPIVGSLRDQDAARRTSGCRVSSSSTIPAANCCRNFRLVVDEEAYGPLILGWRHHFRDSQYFYNLIPLYSALPRKKAVTCKVSRCSLLLLHTCFLSNNRILYSRPIGLESRPL